MDKVGRETRRLVEIYEGEWGGVPLLSKKRYYSEWAASGEFPAVLWLLTGRLFFLAPPPLARTDLPGERKEPRVLPSRGCNTL